MFYKFANWFHVLALLVISLYREESGDRVATGQAGAGAPFLSARLGQWEGPYKAFLVGRLEKQSLRLSRRESGGRKRRRSPA